MLTEENKRDILNSLLDTIKLISDNEYQKRVWIRGGAPGTDFDEIVNFYSLDESGIAENYKEFGITNIQFLILNNFDKKFRDFYDKNDLPEEFVDSSEWAQIMNLAKEVLKAFHYKN